MAFRPCVVQFAQSALARLHTACRLRAYGQLGSSLARYTP